MSFPGSSESNEPTSVIGYIHDIGSKWRLLERILEETTAGDPMSLLKWTGKSTRALAAELTRQGHPLSAMTVCRYSWSMEYSLQGDVKSLECKQHPERDQQFRYLNRQGKSFQRSGDPVISVDTN